MDEKLQGNYNNVRFFLVEYANSTSRTKNRKDLEKTIIDEIVEIKTKTGWKIVSKLAM